MKRLFLCPFSEWLAFFFLLNLACHLSGGIHPVSRLLPVFSLKEDGNFQIDRYKDHTSDWSRTPDGHYYSNKAPGPTLLATPIFWGMDEVITWGQPTREERDETRIRHRVTYLKTFSYLLQILPFLGVVAFLIQWLLQGGISRKAVLIGGLSLM